MNRAGQRGTRVARRVAMVLLAVLAAASCSSPPPVEEVIIRGHHPQADGWCRILDDEAVTSLLGEGDLDRVRQVGEFDPRFSPGASCDVVWADGNEPVPIVNGRSRLLTDNSSYYRDEIGQLRDLLGPEGQRLSSGDVEEVSPGVFLRVDSNAFVYVFLACDVGEELPGVMSTRLALWSSETGEIPSAAELTSLAERAEELTRWVHQCPGEITPLGVDDWEPLLELALASAVG